VVKVAVVRVHPVSSAPVANHVDMGGGQIEPQARVCVAGCGRRLRPCDWICVAPGQPAPRAEAATEAGGARHLQPVLNLALLVLIVERSAVRHVVLRVGAVQEGLHAAQMGEEARLCELMCSRLADTVDATKKMVPGRGQRNIFSVDVLRGARVLVLLALPLALAERRRRGGRWSLGRSSVPPTSTAHPERAHDPLRRDVALRDEVTASL
jgi:hypothetical protein